MASKEPLKRYTRHGRTSASDQNALRQRVEQLDRGGGIAARRMAGVLVPLPDVEPWFFIMLDGASDGGTPPKYTAWHAVDFDGTGAAVPADPTLSWLAGNGVLPAISETGYDAPSGTLAIATFSAQEDAVVFWAYPATGGGGGSGIEVKEADGSPDLSPVVTLVFDNGSVTNPSAGVARITFPAEADPDASATVRGYVNLSNQTLGAGTKTFHGQVQIDNTNPTQLRFQDPVGNYTTWIDANSFSGRVFLTGICKVAGDTLGCAWRLGRSVSSSPQTFEVIGDSGICYAISGTLGVTGTINPGATATGGIVTGTGTPVTGGGSGGLPTRTQGTATAAGTTQGTAATFADDSTLVSGASGTNGIILPDAADGAIIDVWNSSGVSALKVYPPSGEQIGTLGTDNPSTVGISAGKSYHKISATQWGAAVLGS